MFYGAISGFYRLYYPGSFPQKFRPAAALTTEANRGSQSLMKQNAARRKKQWLENQIETDSPTLPVMTGRVNAGFWCNGVENGGVSRIKMRNQNLTTDEH